MTRLQVFLMLTTALCGLLSATAVWAQDSGASSQAPLGDVVRQQREQQQHAKPPKKIVTDEDIPANHMHWAANWVAGFIVIPAAKISGLVPNDDSSTFSAIGQKTDKIYTWFGPMLGDPDYCGSGLDCAEAAFLRHFQKGSWSGSQARILFDSDDTIQNYSARVAHFEVVHDVRGKMQGSVALIQTPIAVVMASCMYSFKDRPDAEPECDTFISSLRLNVPEKYIYVPH